MEQRDGYVKHISFHSPETGFTVLTLSLKGTGEELICVGNFPVLDEGEDICVYGEETNHRIYGQQFTVNSYEITEPATEDEMVRYLGSGAIKGVGTALAQQIVDAFGTDTFLVIEREPERLTRLRGIGEKRAQEIHDRYVEKLSMRNTVMYLQQLGIPLSMALRIIDRYGENTIAVVKTNPYRLAEDISRIGFRTADEIAQRIGGFDDTEYRDCACLLYVLQQALSFGHACLPESSLLSHMQEYVAGIDEERLDLIIRNATIDRKIRTVTESDSDGNPVRYIYTTRCYATEQMIARMLADIDAGRPIREISESFYCSATAELGTELDETQRRAVFEAVSHGVFILTGGPGTGKTTTINAILRVFEKQQRKVLLAAPTGRAAKRMSEATGRDAMTIHRLLECRKIDESAQGEDRGMFQRDESNPLEAEVVIVDEASMVDMFLMRSLLRAVKPGATTLILVGDANQLPSVGPGNVLRDILASEAFSSVCLTKIFRQEEASDIVLNAHRINRGECPSLDNQSRDFFFLARSDAGKIRERIVRLVRDELPKYVEATPYDIQVLTPMRKGELGVERLNKMLQDALNPPSRDKDETVIGDVTFRVGAKVMQTRNNYMLERDEYADNGFTIIRSDTGVFNGDIGVVKSISADRSQMEVIFDRRFRVFYQDKEMEDLEHAFAMTIHKSQGSEYPAVVMPLLSGPKPLLSRNLLYTGVTRAIRCVTILGEASTVRQMVSNNEEFKRYTGLRESIRREVQYE